MSSVAKVETLEAVPRAAAAGRLDSLDFLRGLVMVIMAIDHTRDFFSIAHFEPETLALTSYSLFFTRWITHFCAPLFFFLAGTGAFFYGMRRTPGALSKFLVTRGLWLIVLEFTVIGGGWTFNFPWGFFGVIWALGASMVLLSVIVRLPLKWVAWGSVAVIVLHDLTDTLQPSAALAPLWGLLHVRGMIQFFGVGNFVLFPLVPWFAVMAAGYAFGALLQRSDRRVWMKRIGLAMVVAFVLLRLTNVYGNPHQRLHGVTPGDFHLQPTVEKIVILFLDTEKYPPSLQFLLMTLGPAILLLGFLDGKRIAGLGRPILVFGRVPMFFYVLHIYLIHALATLLLVLRHQPYDWMLHGGFFGGLPDDYGYGLPVVYLVWAIVIFLLYVPCAWFAGLKQRRKDWWLSYL